MKRKRRTKDGRRREEVQTLSKGSTIILCFIFMLNIPIPIPIPMLIVSLFIRTNGNPRKRVFVFSPYGHLLIVEV